MSDISVRQARTSDLRRMLELGELFHNSCAFAHMPFNARHLGENLVHLMASEYGLVLVAEQEGIIVGGLVAGAGNSLSSDVLVAYEKAFFVQPDARGARIGAALLSDFESWADTIGAYRIVMGNSAGMSDSAYQAIVRGRGFEIPGSLAVKVLKEG